jgi:hypothetical protein
MIVAYNDDYIGGGEEMKPKKRLVVEGVILGVSVAGLVLGVLETLAGVYVGPVVAIGCTVGIVVCIRNIRRIKKEVTD